MCITSARYKLDELLSLHISSVLPKNTTQCPRPGLEPGALAPQSSALTMRPPHLPQVNMWICLKQTGRTPISPNQLATSSLIFGLDTPPCNFFLKSILLCARHSSPSHIRKTWHSLYARLQLMLQLKTSIHFVLLTIQILRAS